MTAQYLTELVSTLVAPAKRERLMGFLASERRYEDFLDELLHDPKNFHPDCVMKLEAAQQSPAEVDQILRSFGAEDRAYLISTNRFEDGTEGELRELLEQHVGSDRDVLVYCADANVGYYEGHEGWRYVLRSPVRPRPSR